MKEIDKKITVCMSVYNRESCVSECVKSVLHQTYPYFNFKIVDDGSTDTTFDILNQTSKVDKRVKLFKNNHNFYDSLNKSLDYEADLCIRMDSDDLMGENCIKNLLNAYNNAKADVYFFNVLHLPIKENCIISSKEAIEMFKKYNFVFNPSSMINMHFIKDKNIKYRKKFEVISDYDFWIQIAKNNGTFYCIDDNNEGYNLKYRAFYCNPIGDNVSLHKEGEKEFNLIKNMI